MNDEENDLRLRGELVEAKRIRDEARTSLSEAQSAVTDARAKLRASSVYKALKAAKSRKKRADLDLARAGLQLDAVLDEAMTGRTGLALFDAVQPTTEEPDHGQTAARRGRPTKTAAQAATTP